MYKLTFLNKSGEVDLDIIAGKIISNNIQCNGVSMYSETPDKFDIFTKEKHYQQEQANPLSAYFQQNYSTLNGIQQPQKQQHIIQSSLEQFNMPTNIQQHSPANQQTHRQTHGGGHNLLGIILSIRIRIKHI